MAWNFGREIHALSGFDAGLPGAVDGIPTGETFRVHAAQWLTDGAKVVVQSMSGDMILKCATRSTLNNSATTLDLDSKGKILNVVRLSADSGGYQKACREIPGERGDLANDSNDMMNYATVTDPVYWVTNNSSGNPTLFVKPTPTANQPAYVHHVTYPTVAYNDTAIGNFPDELEHLVVLYAAIKATEYMMLSEEDQEVYAPQLGALKQDYQQGLSALGGKGAPQ
jgi:hypothetical protein